MGPKKKASKVKTKEDLYIYDDKIPSYLKDTIREIQFNNFTTRKEIFGKISAGRSLGNLKIKCLNFSLISDGIFNTSRGYVEYFLFSDVSKALPGPINSTYNTAFVAWKENMEPVEIKHVGNAICSQQVAINFKFSDITYNSVGLIDEANIPKTDYITATDEITGIAYIKKNNGVLRFRFGKTEYQLGETTLKVRSKHSENKVNVMFINFAPADNVIEFFSMDPGTKALSFIETEHEFTIREDLSTGQLAYIFRNILQHNSLSTVFNYHFNHLVKNEGDIANLIVPDPNSNTITNLISTFFGLSMDLDYTIIDECVTFVEFLRLVYNFYERNLKLLFTTLKSVNELDVSDQIDKIIKYYDKNINKKKITSYITGLGVFFKDTGLGDFISKPKIVMGYFTKHKSPNQTELIEMIKDLHSIADNPSELIGINALSNVNIVREARSKNLKEQLLEEEDIAIFLDAIEKNDALLEDVKKNYGYDKGIDDETNKVYDSLLKKSKKKKRETLKEFSNKYPERYKTYILKIKEKDSKKDIRSNEIVAENYLGNLIPSYSEIHNLESGQVSYGNYNVSDVPSYSQLNNLTYNQIPFEINNLKNDQVYVENLDEETSRGSTEIDNPKKYSKAFSNYIDQKNKHGDKKLLVGYKQNMPIFKTIKANTPFAEHIERSRDPTPSKKKYVKNFGENNRVDIGQKMPRGHTNN